MADHPETDPATTHETQRLEALGRYRILDTPPESAFDDIVTIAAEICGVPMALISLVDSKRQWFKAKVGIAVSETPREIAFCAHAIQQNDVLLVEDATKDSRFADNPLVTGDLHLRFYAGTPLETSDGLALGTLCVLDSEPRTLSESKQAALKALGRQVMNLFEMRQALLLKRSGEEREKITLAFSDKLHDLEDPAAIASLTAEVLGQTLQASTAGYGTVQSDGASIHIAQDWTAPGAKSIRGEHSLLSFGECIQSLLQGEDVVVNDLERETQASLSQADDLCRAAGARSAVKIPILEKDRFVAMFYLLDAQPRAWPIEDLSFIKAIAERTRHAIERRRAESNVRTLAASLHEQVEDRTRERDRLWVLSRDPFLIADSSGVWLRVNPAWKQVLGWSEKELLGRTSEWMEHPDDQAKTREEVRKLSEGGASVRFESRFRAKDGIYHWFAWTAVETDGLLYCVARDITDERLQAQALEKSQEQLRQSQKMEAVGQLTGGLAHDFNNLLTGITGSLEMLQSRTKQGRLGDTDRYIRAAYGAAKRAAALTHRLLAFSRRQTLDPKPTDVNRLVADMTELIQRTIGPEISLENVAAAGLWATLIDHGQLENALLNLCINARDAMPRGGKLTIETGNKWFDERTARARNVPPGQYVSLCVSDTGTGMAPEIIARAFDPFFTTKPIGVGTGLGLSMVYGFARQSGGEVRIYSEIDKGTLVCLYLPRYSGAGEPVEAVTEDGKAVGGEHRETVLIVDDEPTVRMLVVDVLQDLGCTAIEAPDGATALTILNSPTKIDLLITDVGLTGGMNGRQLADAARVARPELKVLFITGYAENAVLSHGHLEVGMHVLTKPFTMDELARRIKGLIEPIISLMQP